MNFKKFQNEIAEIASDTATSYDSTTSLPTKSTATVTSTGSDTTAESGKSDANQLQNKSLHARDFIFWAYVFPLKNEVPSRGSYIFNVIAVRFTQPFACAGFM